MGQERICLRSGTMAIKFKWSNIVLWHALCDSSPLSMTCLFVYSWMMNGFLGPDFDLLWHCDEERRDEYQIRINCFRSNCSCGSESLNCSYNSRKLLFSIHQEFMNIFFYLSRKCWKKGNSSSLGNWKWKSESESVSIPPWDHALK